MGVTPKSSKVRQFLVLKAMVLGIHHFKNRPHLDESTIQNNYNMIEFRIFQFMIFQFFRGVGFFHQERHVAGGLTSNTGGVQDQVLGHGGSLCGGIVLEEIANTYIVQAMLDSKHNEDMTHMTNLIS